MAVFRGRAAGLAAPAGRQREQRDEHRGEGNNERQSPRPAVSTDEGGDGSKSLEVVFPWR